MTWKCVTCDRVFETIPEDAVELARPRRRRLSYLYRFVDGSVHDLRRVKPEPLEQAVQQLPEPLPPVVPTLVQEVVQALEELPQPDPITPEITDQDTEEVEESPSTAMAAAFHRLFKS